jgi:hypothetical protein
VIRFDRQNSGRCFEERFVDDKRRRALVGRDSYIFHQHSAQEEIHFTCERIEVA